MGTNYFVDRTNGDDTDDGTTMDDGPGGGVGCWETLKHAVEAGLLVAGDIVWVRRIHIEYPSPPVSDLYPPYDGTPKDPIRVIGWPRTTYSGTSSDWTNGSTAVVIDDADMDREKHQGRFITGPDGFDYLITRVVTASGIVIDREYAGATQANQAATILADEDYALAQAIDDSAWTIKKADWNADADDLPCIDWQNQNFQLRLYQAYFWEWVGFEFRDSADAGVVSCQRCGVTTFRGCLMYTDQDKNMVRCLETTKVLVERTIIEGNGVGANQMGLSVADGDLELIDVAVYNCGDNAFLASDCTIYMENVNLGVEIANGDDEIRVYGNSQVYGRDVKIRESNGLFDLYRSTAGSRFAFENYGKILGAHKVFTAQGEATKVTAGAGGDIANQRAGGAASLIEILFNLTNTTSMLPEPIAGWGLPVFVHEFEADTSSLSYRYYVQSMAIVTAAQLWIEVEYVVTYDDDTEYVISKQVSDEAFTVRADANDWAEFMEVTAIQPAVASKVRIKCYCSFQHASDKIYIDPKVVIS